MRDFPVVIVGLCLLGTSVAMSTGTFVRCLDALTNADQIDVVCNGTKKIAQYCETGRQSCRNKTSPGVSLDGFCLTISNWTYNSWSCEANGYIHDNRQTVEFTVDLSNQHTITSPSPGTAITSPSPGAPITSPSPGTAITSPSPGNSSHSGTIAAGVTVLIICVVVVLVVVVVVLVLMIILYVLYRKVERFKQAVCDFLSILQCNRNPNQEEKDIEAGDGEAGKFLPPGSMV